MVRGSERRGECAGVVAREWSGDGRVSRGRDGGQRRPIESLHRLLLAVHKTAAIPAFARKYGLACSACHTAWPELNAFGQRFRR